MLTLISQPAFSDTTGNKNMIKLTTSLGDILIQTYPDKAPETVKNFVEYVESGFYDDLIFHRVISGFMIQGGGFNSDMKQSKTRASIKNEANNGLKNDTGTLAMARTSDPHSATGQFFINLVDNSFLNHTGENSQGWGYAVFAKVTEGMDVVEKIGAVATGRVAGYGDVPLQPVVIEKAVIVE
jgi:peptidyl-prolyl cis-trans isomerase B (cyclophilin B)